MLRHVERGVASSFVDTTLAGPDTSLALRVGGLLAVQLPRLDHRNAAASANLDEDGVVAEHKDVLREDGAPLDAVRLLEVESVSDLPQDGHHGVCLDAGLHHQPALEGSQGRILLRQVSLPAAVEGSEDRSAIICIVRGRECVEQHVILR